MCGVRSCENMQKRVSHGETVRVGSSGAVVLTTTMRCLTYVTYYVALIGCRSIQLSEEAFFFLVQLKHAP